MEARLNFLEKGGAPVFLEGLKPKMTLCNVSFGRPGSRSRHVVALPPEIYRQAVPVVEVEVANGDRVICCDADGNEIVPHNGRILAAWLISFAADGDAIIRVVEFSAAVEDNQGVIYELKHGSESRSNLTSEAKRVFGAALDKLERV